MAYISTFAILLWLSILSTAFGYYGEVISEEEYITALVGASAVFIADTIYVFGGSLNGNVPNYSGGMAIKFDSNQTLVVNNITNAFENSLAECLAHPLGDGKTIVASSVQYRNVNITDAQGNVTAVIHPGGLAFYDTTTNIWTAPQNNLLLPPLRSKSMSAISPENDAIYSMGGTDASSIENIELPYIYRYDLKNVSSIINVTAINPNLKMDIYQGSAQMLPNGVIVIAFGRISALSDTLVDPTQVTLFDTRKNQIYTQAVSGIPPVARFAAGSALGPDKSTIYYYGGGNQKVLTTLVGGACPAGLIALDTTTWTWFHLDVPGLASIPFSYSSLVLFENTKLITLFGSVSSIYATDIGVIVNVPQSSDNLSKNNMQWYTGNAEFDEHYLSMHYQRRLSDGAIAGITIAVLVIIVLLLLILWRHNPRMRLIGNYIQYEIIWQPRSGEPLWAETSRLLVRFILLFLFLAFVVYSIYRSIESPVVNQVIKINTNVVQVPDVRFCFDGFVDTDAVQLNVYCIFLNGTDCSDQIKRLDMALHTPRYTDNFGDVNCFMFKSAPAYSFINDDLSYSQTTSTKMMFSFQATPMLVNGTVAETGAIYINMYAPGYNPNVKAYNLTDYPESKLSLLDVRKWKIEEKGTNDIEAIILKPSVRTTATYELVEEQTLRTDGWNYIGFSYNYDTTYSVTNSFLDMPQNLNYFNFTPGYPSVLAQLTLQPSEFTININVEQKVFTLLNAVAQVGGVLGLFIAIQTILFGFRPQSPWGVVHRWSFGRLRIKLTDRLANYFNRMGTPVPLVNPVSNRLSTVFKSDIYPPNPDYPVIVDEAVSHETRVHQVEERLQLMELLLKSYYLNDEVFRSLDQAVKRGNDERRRSSMGGILRRSTDSVMMAHDESNEVLELSNAKADVDSTSTLGINRRPSGTVFPQQRGTYQPDLASDHLK